MRRSARIANSRPISAPNPDALSGFLDNLQPPPAYAYGGGGGGGGFSGGGGGGRHVAMDPPPFRPTTTLAGGLGGGFGTGGGFGSTGGFHTMRLQPWQEPKRVDLTDTEPMPVATPSRWAPSTCARAVSHTVNNLRAALEPTHLNRAVVRTDECAAPVAASDPHEPSMVMLPEKFELHTVKVPPTKLVQPPDALFRQDKLMTPKDRESILTYEKQKRMADLVLGRDRHKQMRLIALMQKRFPNGVLGVESAASDGTVVYAATRLSEQTKAQVAHESRLRKQEWIVRNGRSEPHLGYDFLTTIPKDFVPPPGAPERRLWETKRRVPLPAELTDSRARVFQGAGEKQKPAGLPEEGTHAWGRMSNIRARETENKQWNIITGTEYEVCPPRGHEYPSATRNQHRTLHPSLNTGPAPPHVTWGEPGTT
jgi:hypothetical protein|eukprot:Tamp_16906.p1 GENE.Tamp_16906~~Tamp_16906.p1  ORF type:complete len:424 (+),score=87.91 Tamp_16906:48-1319(+)